MKTLELDLTPSGSLSIECVVNGPIETNSYFVGSAGKWVVVDPAWDGERLVEHFKQAHPADELLGAVCTHGHADHVGGVAGVRAALDGGALYALPAKDGEVPAKNIAEQRSMWGIDAPSPGEPTRLLSEGDSVAVGDCRLQVIEVPGHTPGGVVLFAAAENGNVAFVGDTLFPGSHGRTDLAGGDEAAILRSLSKLARLLPPDTVCLTGHGDSTTMARELMQNPFMQM
ncbi:MBL fold metallo-hydrolase [Collinsella sp. AM18-10]|uniref:MBL fold metallo-hydrolase n=1 Tax=Collinsella sp. AM18-10 TaxID=2292028 RepID=UPI000E4D92D5|nr:MBL fold metallo-hydrolase [Collinsella sp. AM18-10]RHH35872.1 MBL fold metallo-hydrolase [Collinsella sp. AM18-10]